MVNPAVARGMLARSTSSVVPDVSLEHEDDDGGGAAFLSASWIMGGYSSQM